MNRKGMIFEGLKVRNSISLAAHEEVQRIADAIVIREEGSYGSSKKDEREEERDSYGSSLIRQVYEGLLEEEGSEICLDVTYFLVFAMSQNPVCQKELKEFPPDRVLHYQKLFLKGSYHGEYFLSSLGYEEYCYAQVLLGMLEEIRKEEAARAEDSYERFMGLVRNGWRDARKRLLTEKQVEYDSILDWARPYAEQPAMGMSQICVVYLLAEQFQVKVVQNIDYYLMLACMVEKNTTWDSSKEEVIEGLVWGLPGKGEGRFIHKLEEQLAAPLRAAVQFRRKEYEDFDYYLQTLFHLGGIDRNVLYGEQIDEKCQRLLIELGGFEESYNLEEYVYSLNIVLLCSYLKKCLEKMKEEHPAHWQQKVEDVKKAEESVKSQLSRITESLQNTKRRCRELEERLEKAERAVRRSENRLQKARQQHQEERRELILLREQIYRQG